MDTVRKTTVLLIIMALVVMLATPAFAEGSPTPETGGATVIDGSGNAVSFTMDPIAQSSPIYQSAQQEIAITSAQELAGVWDITPQGNPPYTIKIPVGESYFGATVYHFNGSSWEELPSSYEGGYAIGISQSASPFSVVVQKVAPTTNAAGSTANAAGGSSGSSSVSPKTGDDSNVYYLIPLMIIAAAVCVFAGRKAVKARG